MIIFKGRHFPKDLILMAVRWKLAYPLSYRNIEELMEERGADVDHSTVQKRVVHYAPQLEESFRERKKPANTVTLETDDESVGFYEKIGFICTPFKGNYGVIYTHLT